MKLNNKGMAISGILYSILVLFLALVFGVLAILASTKFSFDKFRKDLIEELNKNRHDVKIEKILYKEDALNGTDPEYDDELIPITIDSEGYAKKADIYSKWYSYEDKIWANAVAVTRDSREEYLQSSAGTEINEDDILAYFVWIPRFKYYITTSKTSNASSIKISFEDKHVVKSNGDAVSNYFTHPAFTFGDIELNGFWFGKFETTGSSDNVTILPNAYSLRNQFLVDEFKQSLAFKSKRYGITSDTHMVKTYEWSAAAYLTNSVYGLNDEVRLNNNGYYTTGRGALNADGSETDICTNGYGTVASYPQSSTGNIYGIFDMAGGAWDRAMGLFTNNLSDSGFTELPDHKYYDIYETLTTTPKLTFTCNGSEDCRGTMINETFDGYYGSWYGDAYNRYTSSNPVMDWYHFGGYTSSKEYAGIFSSSFHNGANYGEHTYRVVIAQGA